MDTGLSSETYFGPMQQEPLLAESEPAMFVASPEAFEPTISPELVEEPTFADAFVSLAPDVPQPSMLDGLVEQPTMALPSIETQVEPDTETWTPVIKFRRENVLRAAVAAMGAAVGLGLGATAAAQEMAPASVTTAAFPETEQQLESVPAADILRPANTDPTDVTFLAEPVTESRTIFAGNLEADAMKFELLSSDPSFVHETEVESVEASAPADSNSVELADMDLSPAFEAIDTSDEISLVSNDTINDPGPTSEMGDKIYWTPDAHRVAADNIIAVGFFLLASVSNLLSWRFIRRRNRKQTDTAEGQVPMPAKPARHAKPAVPVYQTGSLLQEEPEQSAVQIATYLDTLAEVAEPQAVPQSPARHAFRHVTAEINYGNSTTQVATGPSQSASQDAPVVEHLVQTQPSPAPFIFTTRTYPSAVPQQSSPIDDNQVTA